MNLATMWTCDECGTVMDESKIVTVYVDHPRPGRDRIAVMQCPECGKCECFKNTCDENGCRREATCGWQTKDGGYRRTCFEHMKDGDRAK